MNDDISPNPMRRMRSCDAHRRHSNSLSVTEIGRRVVDQQTVRGPVFDASDDGPVRPSSTVGLNLKEPPRRRKDILQAASREELRRGGLVARGDEEAFYAGLQKMPGER